MNSSDKHIVQRGALTKAEFIISQVKYLRFEDPTGTHEKAVNDFKNKLESGETLNGNQLSYLDNIYEKTMKGMGLGSCNTHYDRNKFKMKFGGR